MIRHKIVFTLLFVLLATGLTWGKVNRPKAVFVQLSTEPHRSKSLANNKAMLENLRTELEKIRLVTMQDFEDNFKAVPCYYFNDSDVLKVSEGKYQGLIFDKDGNQVDAGILQEIGKDFFVVYFGYRKGLSKKSENGKVYYETKANSSSVQGLVVLNNRLLEFEKPLGFIGRPEYYQSIQLFQSKKFFDKKYNYHADGFNMYYAQSANKLDELINRYF